MIKSQTIKELEKKIEIARVEMKTSIKFHSDLCNELSMLIKENQLLENNHQSAISMYDGHSREYLKQCLSEYFETLSKTNQIIFGFFICTDFEIANDEEVIDILIKNFGGKLIHNAYGWLTKFKIDDSGEKLYQMTPAIRRKIKASKKTIVKRARNKEVMNALLRYGYKCDLKMKTEGIE